MKFVHDTYNFTLKFDFGEELVSGLTEFIKDQELKGGWIVGLGGLTKATLGFYDLDSKEYYWQNFDDLKELINLTGNIAWMDDEPALHLHATVSGTDFAAKSGHLKEAFVAGTVEIFIHKWLDESGLNRSKDDKTGLNLLDL